HLSKPHSAEYRLTKLPQGRQECGIYLAISDPDRTWWNSDTKGLGGEVRFEMIDSKGNAVVSVRGRLGDYIWSGSGEFRTLYQMDKSFFVTDNDESYYLRFSYEPEPRLASHQGLVYLRCGGRK